MHIQFFFGIQPSIKRLLHKPVNLTWEPLDFFSSFLKAACWNVCVCVLVSWFLDSLAVSRWFRRFYCSALHMCNKRPFQFICYGFILFEDIGPLLLLLLFYPPVRKTRRKSTLLRYIWSNQLIELNQYRQHTKKNTPHTYQHWQIHIVCVCVCESDKPLDRICMCAFQENPRNKTNRVRIKCYE